MFSLGLTLFVLLGASYTYYATHSLLHIEEQADEYLMSMATNLKAMLYTMDSESIRNVGVYYESHEDISSLRIANNFGDTLYAFDKNLNKATVHRSQDVFYNGLLVGSIQLTMSRWPHQMRVMEVIMTSVLLSLVVGGLLLLVTYRIVHTSLEQPMEHLSSMAASIASGDFDGRSIRSPRVEFQGVVDALNTMGQAIQKQMEQLRLAEAEYRSIFQNVPNGIVQATPDGRAQKFNQPFAELLGFSSVEEAMGFLGDDMRKAYADPRDRERMLDVVRAEGYAHRYECDFIRGDGVVVPVAITIRGTFQDGELVRLDSIIEDITRSRKAETALRESETRFRNLAELLPVGVWEAGRQFRMTYVNPTGLAMFGFDERDMAQGLGGEDFLDSKIYARTLQLCQGGNGEMSVRQLEYTVRRKDGSSFPALSYVEPVWNRQGEFDGLRGVVIDNSSQKEAEHRLEEMNRNLEQLVQERTRELAIKADELERANAELLKLDEMKSALLSSVSHELRTPLTSIFGYSKLISKDFCKYFHRSGLEDETLHGRGERIRQNLTVIASEGERLTRLIDDLLDLNKIESGRMQWNDRVIRPYEVLNEAFTTLSGTMGSNNEVRMLLKAEPDLPRLYMDPDRLFQVCVNLLSNAIKFTDTGWIEMRAMYQKDGVFRVEVEDTGPGIRPEDTEQVFDTFYQVCRSGLSVEKPKGTGLGLPICKQIVEYYQGSIWVEEGTRGGSLFVFELPVVVESSGPV